MMNLNFMVKVNGELIHQNYINRRYRRMLEEVEATGENSNTNSLSLKNLAPEIINECIDDFLLLQYGKENSLVPSQEALNHKIIEIKNENQNSSFWNTLSNIELIEEIRNKMIIEAVIQQQINHSGIDDEENLRHIYKNNKQHFAPKKGVKMRHILIKIENRDNDSAYQLIESALNRIKNGEDFVKVAKDVSECPSAVRGGDLGFIVRGSLNNSLESTGFKLKKNEISDILKTEYGYHIIQVTQKVKNYVPSFHSLQKELKKFIAQQIGLESLNPLLETLRDKANIEYIGLT